MSTEDLKSFAVEEQLRFQLKVRCFELMPDAVVVADFEGNIRLINEQAVRMFGYHSTELEGQKVEVLVPERLRQQHAEHRKNFWRSPEARWMGKGKPLPAVTKDGDEFEAHIMLAPLWNEQGRFMITVLRKKAFHE